MKGSRGLSAGSAERGPRDFGQKARKAGVCWNCDSAWNHGAGRHDNHLNSSSSEGSPNGGIVVVETRHMY
jgi:hypothetical protein